MKPTLLATSAVAIVTPVPVAAQAMAPHRHMVMERPEPKPKTAWKAQPTVMRAPRPRGAAALSWTRTNAFSAETAAPVKDDGAGAPPVPERTMESGAPGTQPMDHAAMGHDMAAMPGMNAAAAAYATGSGTSRNPGNDGAMHGVHFRAGGWTAMLHGYAWGVYTDQGGPRGQDEAFALSMAMLSAARDLGGGARVQTRAMLSLEPLMGATGYPDLFATGETADGRTPLIDRQHPHDLFMELSARLDVDAGSGSAFLYGGPVAEPALGPSAFMHRASAAYAPLAPITHHWFDSTHITYGVVTAGYAAPRWQIEASAFRGHEPDQHRWDIETPRLDSWSVRAAWTPSPTWAVQASHGRLENPEQLEPGRDEARTTASVQYAKGGLSALLAFSAKDKLPGPVLTAWLAEASWELSRHHTLFGRFEHVANDELFPDPADPRHDRSYRISKLEGGYAYRVPFSGPASLALGGAIGIYGKPDSLDSAYGAFPVSFTLFAKASLGH